MSEIDPHDFRSTMANFCTGVVVATGMLHDEPTGFAAQSFVSLSLEPPLVAVCPALTSSSWPKLRAAGHFCINVLGADQKPVCDAFARKGPDKFAGIGWQPAPSGAPIIDDVLAWVDCTLEAEHDAGDHTIAVGRVGAMAVRDDQRGPLLFFRGGYGAFRLHE